MEPQLGVGDPIVIVQSTASPPRQHPGLCADQRGDLIAATLEVDVFRPASFRESEPVIIVRHSDEGRYAAPARYVKMDMAGGWFRLMTTEWRLIEERQAPRVAAQAACELVGGTDGAREAATILDISEGGARVSVSSHVNDARLELHLNEGPEPVALPCVLLARKTSGEQTELRVRFAKLTDVQERAVRKLIDEWTRERKAA